ncbi:tyrosine recombinase XerD [Clostridiales bacterium]|nr:tyrosine recombinase XerD [Clostridiales bacterium]
MKKRKDGRYVLTRVIDGKSVTVYGKTKEEVYSKLEAKKQEKERCKTFSELVELWKDAKWDSFAYGTQNCYRSALTRAIDDFGNVPNNEVTPQMVQRLIEEMIAQKYSAKSIKTQKTVISTVYRYAIIHKQAKENPATVCVIPRGLPKEVREPPTEQELEQIRNDKGGWLYPQILLYTGCRKGEALALCYEDFDFDKKTISITKEVVFDSNTPHIVHHTKTQAGVRTIGLLDALAEQLPKNKTGQIFHYTLSAFRHEWERYCKKLEIDITPHQLRHAYATMLFNANVPVKLAQKLLGHADIQTTQNIYTHIRDSRIEDATESLNDYIQNLGQNS